MNIYKLIEKLSRIQKIFIIGLIAFLFLGLWFSLVSSLETKFNNNTENQIQDISFDASLCIDLKPTNETETLPPSASPIDYKTASTALPAEALERSADEATASTRSDLFIQEICQERLDALELIKQFKEIKEKALGTNVEIWALSDFNSLGSIEKDIDRYFNQNLFSEAVKSLNEGIEVSNNIIKNASIALNQFIESGFNFLQLNSAIDAEISFKKALEIDPKNSLAIKGLSRAVALDQVSNYINDINLLISVNSLDRAKNLINKAIQLDDEYPGINQLRSEIDELIQIRDLESLISDGFKYLKLLRFADAKIIFEKALELEENSKIASEGINLANEGIKKNTIEDEKVFAYESMNLEDFTKSSMHFQNILDLDPNIQFAILGLQEVQNLVELEFHLDRYLDRPERLSSPNVFEEAIEILNSSNSLNLQKRLFSKKEKLEFLLNEYANEINIILFSDNKTQVSILNVGTLGTFNKKEIKLYPGKYTFIGKRKGFVTIRQIFDFTGSTSVKIQCIEKL